MTLTAFDAVTEQVFAMCMRVIEQTRLTFQRRGSVFSAR